MRDFLKHCLFSITFFLASCEHDASCDKIAKDFKDNAQFHLVLTEKENHHSRDAFFYGIDLKTKKENTKFYDGSGWIAQNFDKFKVGDTLIKDAGKYTIIIKRGKKAILIPYVCQKYISDYDRREIRKVYYDTVLKK